jgi:GNAT superfamily N-acetyltransferase
MALREAPPAPDLDIAEVSFDDVAPSRRKLTLEIFPGDEALADQLRVLDRRLEGTIGGRWFAVREGREVISRAWLLSADGVGQVEDVATASTHRGTGLARAVVSAAARASRSAGDDLTFVIADAGETTPELYRKTGFEPVGFKRRFVKKLG